LFNCCNIIIVDYIRCYRYMVTLRFSCSLSTLSWCLWCLNQFRPH